MDAIREAMGKIIPEEVKMLSRVLAEAGLRSWVVGGSVRDVALALQNREEVNVDGDWDLATDARPERVQKLFRKVIPTGLQHGTVTVVLNKEHFELTTLRGERGHSDGRRPDEVFFVDDLEADLARRDFTVNAMAYSVTDGTFHDPFQGADDLKAGVLRAVGEPAQRFSEDGLRVLRCARFCATIGLDIEQATKNAIVPSLGSFKKVALERVCDEWFKALKSKTPSRFFRAISEHQMLVITAPEIWGDATRLSFDDALARVDAAPADPLLRLALFVLCGTSPDDSPAQVAQALAERLRLSKMDGEQLKALCAHGMLPKQLLKSAHGYEARKWLALIGRDVAGDVLMMQQHLDSPHVPKAELMARHSELQEELDSGAPLTLKELALTGGDLIKDAAVPKGPQLGQILAALLEEVLRDPAKNERSQLLHLAKELR